MLGRCIQRTTNPLDHNLAVALADAAPDLHWASPYDEVEGGPQLERLKTGYICTVLTGPRVFRRYRSPYRSDDLLVAFSAQWPKLYYPRHAHLAREIYHVISGRSQWQRGEDWSTHDCGDWIYHPSNVMHAMQTSDEPLLAMAIWIDGLDQPAVTVEELDP